MFKKLSLSVGLAVAFLLLTAFVLSAQGVSARKIVVFSDSVVNEAAQQSLVEGVGGVVLKPLPLINGLSVVLPDRASERALEARVGVVRVEDDVQVSVSSPPSWAKKGKKPKTPFSSSLISINRIRAGL